MNALIESVEEAYRDYFNNYLTVTKFAIDYGLTDAEAALVIELGRSLNHRLNK